MTFSHKVRDRMLLFEVKYVEVLRLGSRLPPTQLMIGSSQYMVSESAFASVWYMQQIIWAWRFLLPGEQARYHEPWVALRFHDRNSVRLTASVCWNCNNVHTDGANGFGGFAFDASTRIAQGLFSLCERVLSSERIS